MVHRCSPTPHQHPSGEAMTVDVRFLVPPARAPCARGGDRYCVSADGRGCVTTQNLEKSWVRYHFLPSENGAANFLSGDVLQNEFHCVFIQPGPTTACRKTPVWRQLKPDTGSLHVKASECVNYVRKNYVFRRYMRPPRCARFASMVDGIALPDGHPGRALLITAGRWRRKRAP